MAEPPAEGRWPTGGGRALGEGVDPIMNWWSRLLDSTGFRARPEPIRSIPARSSGPVEVDEEEEAPVFPPARVGVRNLDARDHLAVALNDADKKLLFEIGRQVRTQDLKLPPLPTTGLTLLEMVDDPSAEIAEVVEQVSRDPVLAGELLRAASVGRFADRGEIQNLRQAVVRLGMRSLRSQILGGSMRACMFRARKLQAYAEEIWRQARSVAALSRGLARTLDADPERIYLLGLMHDVGKLPLLALLGREARRRDSIRGAILSKAFFFFHEKVGEALARKWELPEEVCSVAGCHHRFQLNTSHARMAAAVSLAHKLDLCLSLGREIEFRGLVVAPEMSFLGLEAEQRPGILARALVTYLQVHSLAAAG